jgi:hypothetical protein
LSDTDGDGVHTAEEGWSKTYVNFEMVETTPVEIEISKVSGDPIESLAVHPWDRAESWSVVDGKGYITLEEPTLFFVDVDSQMDRYHTGARYDGQYGLRDGYGGTSDAVLIFANPILADKPDLYDPSVLVVQPGTLPPDLADPGYEDITTLYFAPGVHDIEPYVKANIDNLRYAYTGDTSGYRIRPYHSYYIPGDAYVFGQMNTRDQWDAAQIRVFGHGTLSGKRIPHPHCGTGTAYTQGVAAGTGRTLVAGDELTVTLRGDFDSSGVVDVDEEYSVTQAFVSDHDTTVTTLITALNANLPDTAEWTEAFPWRVYAPGFNRGIESRGGDVMAFLSQTKGYEATLSIQDQNGAPVGMVTLEARAFAPDYASKEDFLATGTEWWRYIMLQVRGAAGARVEGITITDCPLFCGTMKTTKDQRGTISWAKVMAFRVNTDGPSGPHVTIDNCYIEANDDLLYVHDGIHVKNSIFANLTNGQTFVFARFGTVAAGFDPPAIIEDSVVIYSRVAWGGVPRHRLRNGGCRCQLRQCG